MKAAATMAHRRWKVLQRYELIAGYYRTKRIKCELRCPFALSGTGARPVPSVAALPCFDMRLGSDACGAM